MTVHLNNFITRVVAVEALQLSLQNMEEAAALCGGSLEQSIHSNHTFVLWVPTPMGPVCAKVGWWLVRTESGWVAMGDKSFKRKFELANDKGERVPPYDIQKGVPLTVESIRVTENGMLVKASLPDGYQLSNEFDVPGFSVYVPPKKESDV